ncbi:MAG: hypothetical protein JNM45_16040, partial [Rhizobiales bacterium]|nr:hypothetical protein [Hyphomicrobiales bacterium]
MSSSSVGVTPAPDLETPDIAEEIRRQLASARNHQTSDEVAQRHETVLSNIMLPGQVNAEPGSIAETGVATGSTPPPLPGAEAITTQEEASTIVAQTRLQSGSGIEEATQDETPHYGDSSPSGSSTTFLPPSDDVVFGNFAAASPQPDRAVAKAPAPPPVTTSEVQPPEPPPENHAPEVSAVIADQAATEDAGFSFQLPSGSF